MADEPITFDEILADPIYKKEFDTRVASHTAEMKASSESYCAALRTVLGLKDDEDLGDLNDRITTFQQQQTASLEAAKTRLIQAELRALPGYDHKLLAKVIDLSKAKVDEQGNVTGVKEAAETAAKEFPAVKAGVRAPYVPPNPAAGGTPTNENQQMNDLIRGRR